MYDNNYTQWKKWGSAEFGHLSKFSEIYFDAEFNNILHFFNLESSILEVGYGSGEFLRYALQRGFNVIGLEKNPKLVEDGQAHGFSCFQFDHLLNIEDSSINLIVLFDVLEHLDSYELKDIFFQFNRILKIGGVIFARFPNGDSPLGMPYQNGDLTHKSSIGSHKIQQLANMSGLQILSIKGEIEISRNRHPVYICFFFIIKNIRRIINIFYKLIFGGKNLGPYCSRNITALLTKNSN